MSKLTQIAPVSAALHVGLVMGAVGLVAGVIYAVGGVFVDLATIGLNSGTAMAFGALIGMPVYLGLVGGLTAGLAAWAYNLVARRFGGIEMRFDQH